MQSFRLKNIIIVILLLVNLFLLGSLVSRRAAQHDAQQQVRTQLTELFAADGVKLSEKALSFQAPPVGGTLTRDTELDRKMAAFFLGEGVTYSDQGGGIDSYTGIRGAAVFRSGGGFDAVSRLDEEKEAETFFRKFCKTYQYEELEVGETEDAFTATAVRWFNGYPVVNCTVCLSVDADHHMKASGTHLPARFTPDSTEEPLSAVAALTSFLEARQESGAVVSAVTDVYPCYELQSTTAAVMTLIPAWCVVTDAAYYYVNCYTGAVTHS